MATLKRCHTPVPWGAHVETMVWQRSKRGTPRRRRSDKPTLIHDPEWDWDGKRVLFSDETVTSEREERDCEIGGFQLREDEHSPILSEGRHATLSLLDVARYQVMKRRKQGRSGNDDFEVIRVPRVIPVLDEESDLGEGLGEWERLDAWVFKRTYSEVARGFVDRKDHANTPGGSQLCPSGADDDHWEYL